MQRTTNSELAPFLAKRSGVTEKDVLLILNNLDDTIAEEVAAGKTVQLNGLGSVKLVVSGWTNKTVPIKGVPTRRRIPARYKLHFTASELLLSKFDRSQLPPDPLGTVENDVDPNAPVVFRGGFGHVNPDTVVADDILGIDKRRAVSGDSVLTDVGQTEMQASRLAEWRVATKAAAHAKKDGDGPKEKAAALAAKEKALAAENEAEAKRRQEAAALAAKE